jgi:hypothetical protein
MDIIKLDVPLFIRLLELAREEIKNDADLHDVAEAVTKLSQKGVVTMDDYPIVVKQMNQSDNQSQSSNRMQCPHLKLGLQVNLLPE